MHYSEQIEAIEKWLDGYMRSTSKLIHDISSLESVVNSQLAQSTPPSHVSEAVLDHDYTLLAMKRYNEAAKDFWSFTTATTKKMDSTIVEPVRRFQQGDLKSFKVWLGISSVL